MNPRYGPQRPEAGRDESSLPVSRESEARARRPRSLLTFFGVSLAVMVALFGLATLATFIIGAVAMANYGSNK